MEPYYYTQLSKQQQRVYQIIKNGLESLSDRFDVPRLEHCELSDIFYKIRLDCPEIFYASTFKYSYYPDSNMVQMKPEYLFEKNKIREHQKAMKSRVEKLARAVKEKSEWEKEKYIHDFICENVTYDKLKKQYSHEIIGPLGQGVGVCEGIAKAVKILCDELSIPCIIVISENNPEKKIKYRHAWNLIYVSGTSGNSRHQNQTYGKKGASNNSTKMERKWYHLDATFDNSLGKKELRYDYFNLDDKSIFKDHEPSIYKIPDCSDGEHFYYREKKLSFTKQEEVAKRCQQAIKKKQVLTFHWRGGYLTKAVLEELLQIIGETAKEKEKHTRISINWPQAVIQAQFLEEQTQDTVKMEDAYEEENQSQSEI